jgi:hypothetical protein
MYRYHRLLISLGTIAAGMAWSGGYAHATYLGQGVAPSQPFEIAQSSGSGGRPEARAPAPPGSTADGTHSGDLGRVAPSGAKPDPSLGHTGPGNMDTGTGTNRYRGDVGMGGATGTGARTDSAIRPGDEGSNSTGSAGRSASGAGGSSRGSGAADK